MRRRTLLHGRRRVRPDGVRGHAVVTRVQHEGGRVTVEAMHAAAAA